MTEAPKPGRYRHYKRNNEYTVIDVVTHSETEEIMVLYRAEYGNFGLWVRPIEMFEELVDFEGRQVPRFTYLGE